MDEITNEKGKENFNDVYVIKDDVVIVTKTLIICPECKGLASFNYYFGTFICSQCDWRDDTYSKLKAKILNEKNKNIMEQLKTTKISDEKDKRIMELENKLNEITSLTISYLKYIIEKHNIKSIDDIKCPYTKRLAQAMDVF